MRKFRIGPPARVVGLLAIGAAVVATDLHLQQPSVSPADHSDACAAAPSDPLERELLRCQAIGIKAKDDAACGTAWAENRRRFFAPFLDQAAALLSRPNSRQPR